jgi:PAS domain S-box-containing protein
MSEQELAKQIEQLRQQIQELQVTLQSEIKARQQVESLLRQKETSQETSKTQIADTSPGCQNLKALIDWSPEFVNQILNTIPDPIFVKNPQHSYLMVNDAFCKFSGYRREDLIGYSDEQIFPKDQVEFFRSQERQVLNSGIQVENNEEQFIDAVGKTHIVSTKLSCFEDATGKKILVGTSRDVTDEKQMQLALLESQERFLSIFDQAAVGIAQVSLEESSCGLTLVFVKFWVIASQSYYKSGLKI